MSRASSHHNWGNLGYRSSAWARFFNMIGFTDILDNPDSWEGWHWGATHAYGFYWRLGNPEHYDLLEDALRNTELLISWSNDPDTTHGIYGGTDSAVWRLWLRDKGIKTIFLDPFHNYTAAHVGEKWIAYRPGTTSALALAIAHVWLEEGHVQQGIRRQPHVRVRRVQGLRAGRERRGSQDPRWAAEISGVEARTISALGPRVGLSPHLPCRRHQRRRRRRLPPRLRHRVREAPGLPAGHAGAWSSGNQHLGDGQRAAVQPHPRIPGIRPGRFQPHR